jgi:hypothetical protein
MRRPPLNWGIPPVRPAAGDPVNEEGPTRRARLDRRNSVRYCIPHGLTVQVNASSSWRRWWPARLLDVSRGGVGLLLDEPLLLETVVQVRVPGWPGRPLLIVVRHVTREGGRWRCGGPLLLRLTDGELQALLGLVLGPATDPINAPSPEADGQRPTEPEQDGQSIVQAAHAPNLSSREK